MSESTPLTPYDRRYSPDITGTPVEILGMEWLLADYIPTLDIKAWDYLYDQNQLCETYETVDLMIAATGLIEANYELSPDESVMMIRSVSPRILARAIELAMGGPDRPHIEYSRWATVSLLANGLDPANIPANLRRDVLSTLVRTHRAVPPQAAITSMITAAHPTHRILKARRLEAAKASQTNGAHPEPSTESEAS